MAAKRNRYAACFASMCDSNPESNTRATEAADQSSNSTKVAEGEDIDVPDGTCGACGSPATMRCASCQDAPSLLNSKQTINGAWYCSESCKTSHWAEHKDICEKLQQRILLQRAADFIKNVWLILRRSAWDLDVESVAIKGKEMQLFFDRAHVQMCTHFVQPFPASLAKNHFILNALLTYRTCDVAVIWLRPLLAQLLQDQHVNISFIAGTVDDSPLRPHFMGGKDVSYIRLHEALKVTLRSGESWTVDPTAAQYGWLESMVPWATWQKRIANAGPSPHTRADVAELIAYCLREPCHDLFNHYQVHEQADVARLLFERLLPCVLRESGGKTDLSDQDAVKSIIQESSAQTFHERTNTVYDRLNDVFPFCIQHWLATKGKARREEIRAEFLDARPMYRANFPASSEAEIAAGILARQHVTGADVKRAFERSKHKAFALPKNVSESSSLIKEVFSNDRKISMLLKRMMMESI